MGHRFSKTAANNIAAAKTSSSTTTTNNNNSKNNNSTSEQIRQQQQQLQAFNTTTNIIPIPDGKQQAQFVGPTINLQIQESPNISYSAGTTGANCIGASASINSFTAAASGVLQTPQQQQQQHNTNSISSNSLTSVNNLSCGGRQIIIKIQLAKMENGNEAITPTATTSSPAVQRLKDTSLENLTADCNLNSTESSSLSTVTTASGTQILNLTLNSSSSSCNSTSKVTTTTAGLTSVFSSSSKTSNTSSSDSTSTLYGTAGSSLNKNKNNNNYFYSNSIGNSSYSVMPTTSQFERPERSLQFNDGIVEQNIGEIVEYCEVLEQQQQQQQQPTQALKINEGKPTEDVKVKYSNSPTDLQRILET